MKVFVNVLKPRSPDNNDNIAMNSVVHAASSAGSNHFPNTVLKKRLKKHESVE